MDASYEVKELYVPENKLHLAKTDAETLPALKINKVSALLVFVLSDIALYYSLSVKFVFRLCLRAWVLVVGGIIVVCVTISRDQRLCKSFRLIRRNGFLKFQSTV